MTSKKNNMSTSDAALFPAPTVGKADPTKRCLPLDVRSTLSNSSDQDPMAIFICPQQHSNPWCYQKYIWPHWSVSNITTALLFIIAPISYKPKLVLLHLEGLKEEFINNAATYKEAVPHPKTSLLIAVNINLKILTCHLQYHHTHSYVVLNLNPDLKAEDTIRTHCFQKVKNHIDDVVLPRTPGDYRTRISSSDVCITDNMNMYLTHSPQTDFYFPT